jgi:tetratricopeptide (TPR) repeat protein
MNSPKIGTFLLSVLLTGIALWVGCAATAPGTSLDERTVGLYKQGADLYENQKYVQAIYLLKQALDFNPEFSEAYYVLGLTYLKTDDFSNAIGQFRKANQFEAVTEKPGFDKADIEFNMGIARISLEELDSARVHFENATELRKGFAKAHYNLAFIAERQNRTGDAYKNLEFAVQADSTMDTAYVALGQLQRSDGKITEAKASLEKAIKINKENKEAHLEMGYIFQLEQDYETAARFYRRALQLDEKYLDAHFLLGEMYEKQESYEEALQSFKKISELTQNSPAGFSNTIKVSDVSKGTTLSSGKPDAMVELTRDYLDFKIATIYEKMGDTDKALATYRKVVETNPNHSQSYFNLALLLHREGNLDEALEVYRQFVKLVPEDDERAVEVRSILKQLGKI